MIRRTLVAAGLGIALAAAPIASADTTPSNPFNINIPNSFPPVTITPVTITPVPVGTPVPTPVPVPAPVAITPPTLASINSIGQSVQAALAQFQRSLPH